MQLIFHFGKLKNTNIKYGEKKEYKNRGICLVDVNNSLNQLT